MSTMASFGSKMEGLIDQANDVGDLIGIIKQVPLQRVKDFVKQHVRTVESTEPDALCPMFHKSFPIDRILSTDAIQTVLSFLPNQSTLKSVNKHFNQMVLDNETLRKRARTRNIASQFNGSNVWLVDPKRENLNADEKQKGIKGPIASLQKALECIESGDKILLAEGRHFLGYSFGAKDVRIEGIGECAISLRDNDFEETGCDSDIYIEHKVSLSNIRTVDPWTSFGVNEGASLWMTDCVLNGSTMSSIYHIGVSSKGRADLLRVHFIGGEGAEGAIQASEDSSISACDCLFDSCGGGMDHDPCIHVQEPETVSLRLVGNVFTNLSTLPIGTEYSTRIKASDGFAFRNNRIGHRSSDIDILYAFTD